MSAEIRGALPNGPGAALVTGGVRRVGAAICRRLAGAGIPVIVHERKASAEAADLVTAIIAEGGRAATIAADLAEVEVLDGVSGEASAMFGPLSLLVNNAALFRSDRFEDFTNEALDAHIAVNLRAPVMLARAFAVQAVGVMDPSVVCIIDHRVEKLTPQHFTYTLSKVALHAAMVTMAQALAPQVRVNGIGPGPTLPNIHDGVDGFAREAAGVPLGHAVDPDDIAEAVLYLAHARSVTGQMIAVDAGQHIGWRTPDIFGA